MFFELLNASTGAVFGAKVTGEARRMAFYSFRYIARHSGAGRNPVRRPTLEFDRVGFRPAPK